MVYSLKSAPSERFTSPVTHQNGIPNENKHMNQFTSVLVFGKAHFKIQKEDYSYMIKHTLFGIQINAKNRFSAEQSLVNGT